MTIQKRLRAVAWRKEISRSPRASTSRSSSNSTTIKAVKPTQAHTGKAAIHHILSRLSPMDCVCVDWAVVFLSTSENSPQAKFAEFHTSRHFVNKGKRERPGHLTPALPLATIVQNPLVGSQSSLGLSSSASRPTTL